MKGGGRESLMYKQLVLGVNERELGSFRLNRQVLKCVPSSVTHLVPLISIASQMQHQLEVLQIFSCYI